jgi:hypothetical protein
MRFLAVKLKVNFQKIKQISLMYFDLAPSKAFALQSNQTLFT